MLVLGFVVVSAAVTVAHGSGAESRSARQAMLGAVLCLCCAGVLVISVTCVCWLLM